MRNPILKGSLLIALGYFPVLGCGGGGDDESQGLGKGGSGGAAASNGRGGNGRGGNGNGGTGIPIGGASSGASSGGASAGTTGDDACVADTRNGSRAIAALYFMVDISGSMSCPVPEEDPPCTGFSGTPGPTTRWTGASQAYKDFFSSSAANGLWAGIGFFSGESCSPANYGPEVEIAELPGNAMALSNAVDDQTPSGNTPTVPSLTAAIDHARDWANAHTDQQGIVVYATDGYPRGCDQNNTIDDAVTVAAEGLRTAPSIHTYVLAIGPNLTDLNRVAVAGGTNAAIAIDTGMDVGQQLIEALNGIRNEVVVDCAYTIPPAPPGETIDFTKVNVSITGTGDPVPVGKDDPSDNTCNGWRYDDPVAPTQIILCGDACDAVTNDSDAGLDVTFDCRESVVEPP